MKIVVIGAAPTGLGVAYRLNELQMNNDERAKDVELVVLEKEREAGGLSCTVTDDKGFLWDMGGHITFDHNFPYYQNATKWAVDEWNHLNRNCQVDVNYMFNEDGVHLVPYPAQYAIPLFPEKIKANCLKDLQERFKNECEDTPKTFDDWILNHFGSTLREHFFLPYTRKVWTVEPKAMNPVWIGSRVAKLPQEKLEELCAMSEDDLKHVDLGWGPNAVFRFPKYGGTGAVWRSMVNKLPQKWFKFNCEVKEVNATQKRLSYIQKENDGTKSIKEIDYDVLINSTPIDLLVKNVNLCPELNLLHSKVYVIGIGLELPMTEFVQKFTWLYFPDPAVPFYRVTIFSRYGEVTPDSSKYWSVMCECARNIDDEITKEEMSELAISGLIKKGIMCREKIVDVYSVVLDYGYPIPSVERDSELARAHKTLEEHQIFSRGRFGGWKYEASNQDHCFIQGKEVIDRVLLNEPERLYKTGVALRQG